MLFEYSNGEIQAWSTGAEQYARASLLERLQPGTLERVIDPLAGLRLGLEPFELRYRKERIGQRTYDPGARLNVTLYAYAERDLLPQDGEGMPYVPRVIVAFRRSDARPLHVRRLRLVDADLAWEVFRRARLACVNIAPLGSAPTSLASGQAHLYALVSEAIDNLLPRGIAFLLWRFDGGKRRGATRQRRGAAAGRSLYDEIRGLPPFPVAGSSFRVADQLIVEHFKFCPSCGSSSIERSRLQDNRIDCPECSFVLFFNPSCSAGALVFDDAGRLLVIERAREPAKGKFGIPGGFADFGERLEEVVAREAEEEINAQLESITFFASFPNRYHYREVIYPVTDAYFLARVRTFDQLKPEASEVRGIHFVDPKNVPQDQWAFPSLRMAVALYLEQGCPQPRG